MFPTLDMLKEGYEIYIPAVRVRRSLHRSSYRSDGSRRPGRRRSDHDVSSNLFRAANRMGTNGTMRA